MNGHMYFVATILTQGIWAGANAWNIAVVFIVAAVGVLMFGCPHVPVRWKWRLHMYLQSVSAFVVASATARKQDPQIYMIQTMILIIAICAVMLLKQAKMKCYLQIT
tara:strand:- start:3663 stop:3983 length:321 start_codon:yes stop_codon:yes gene_type:complete